MDFFFSFRCFEIDNIDYLCVDGEHERCNLFFFSLCVCAILLMLLLYITPENENKKRKIDLADP